MAPIRLLSIESEGFSYFPRQEIILHEGINAGIGENGSGKTTFNNMLRLLFGASQFDNSHTLRTFFEREDIYEIYVIGKFDNSFQSDYNMRPFEPIGKTTDTVSVVCRLLLNDPQVKRNYLIYDGKFDLEQDLKKNLRWLNVEQFLKQFHEVGISRALIRSFSFSQGNTEDVLKKNEEELAEYLLQICGEQERIDTFHHLKNKISEQQQQFQALSEQKELEEARVERLQDRIERCKQINEAEKQKSQSIFNQPISEYLEWVDVLEEHKKRLEDLQRWYQTIQMDVRKLLKDQESHFEKLSIIEKEYKELQNDIKKLWDKKTNFELELAALNKDLKEIDEFLLKYRLIEPIEEKVIDDQVNLYETLLQEKITNLKVVERQKQQLEQSIQRLEEKGEVEFPERVNRMLDALKEKGIEYLLVADYIEIVDESWREAIEALFGSERFTITVSDQHIVDVMKIAQLQKYPYWISPFRESTFSLPKNSILQKVNVLDRRIAGYLEEFQNYIVCNSMVEARELVRIGKKAILNHPNPYRVVSRGGRLLKAKGKYCGKQAFQAQLKDKRREYNDLLPLYKDCCKQMEDTKQQFDWITGVKEVQKNVRLLPQKLEEQASLLKRRQHVLEEFEHLKQKISIREKKEDELFQVIKALTNQGGALNEALNEKKNKEKELAKEKDFKIIEVQKAQDILFRKKCQLTKEQIALSLDECYVGNLKTPAFYTQQIKELENRIVMLRNISSTDIIAPNEEKKLIQLEQKCKKHQKVLKDHKEEILSVQKNLRDLIEKHRVAEEEYHLMVEEVFVNVRKSLRELCKGTNIQADLRAFHLGEERWKVDYRIAFHGKELRSYRIKTGLSGGQKVIASLLLTFAAIRSDGNLSFMILDEPFAHLDQERINIAGEFLRQTGVQFFIAMPYSENVKIFMPWVDMQLNFRPKALSKEVAPPITYGVVNNEYLKQREAI